MQRRVLNWALDLEQQDELPVWYTDMFDEEWTLRTEIDYIISQLK